MRKNICPKIIIYFTAYWISLSILLFPNCSFNQHPKETVLRTQSIELLSKCGWGKEENNLLITGISGSGKPYLSCALCITALRQLKDVSYIKASTMMRELKKARKKDTYSKYLEEKLALNLLVIDDFGLMELDLDKCQDLFKVIDGRDSRRSTIIVSQVPIVEWYDMFTNKANVKHLWVVR